MYGLAPSVDQAGAYIQIKAGIGGWCSEWVLMMINPDTENRVHLVVRTVAAGAVVCALGWGLMPIHAKISDVKPIASDGNATPSIDTEQLAVSADAFDLTLWYSPPPAAQRMIPKPRQQARVSFELLAISASQDDSGSPQKYSVIYDSQDDSIHTLLLGQTIRGYTISEIDSDSVMMTAGKRTIMLSLDAEGAG